MLPAKSIGTLAEALAADRTSLGPPRVRLQVLGLVAYFGRTRSAAARLLQLRDIA